MNKVYSILLVFSSDMKNKQRAVGIQTTLCFKICNYFTDCVERFSVKQQLRSEDPVALVFLVPVGIHHETACLREIPAEIQLLAFPGFVQIAKGEFPQGVILVEIRAQQVVDPV